MLVSLTFLENEEKCRRRARPPPQRGRCERKALEVWLARREWCPGADDDVFAAAGLHTTFIPHRQCMGAAFTLLTSANVSVVVVGATAAEVFFFTFISASFKKTKKNQVFGFIGDWKIGALLPQKKKKNQKKNKAYESYL